MPDDTTIALEPLNDFALCGSRTEIYYSTASFDGRPRLSYRGPAADRPRLFSGEAIETLETPLGLEVTVELDLVLDGDSRTLTLVLPTFRYDGREEQFCTFAVVTTSWDSLAGPPPGRTYEVVALDGVARAVEL